MHRRKFIRELSLGGLALQASGSFAFPAEAGCRDRPVTVGWITDVHHGFCPDASRRLEAFIEEAGRVKPDFILQGGDFCHPTQEARAFMRIWEGFKGRRVHVLGNHDMDKGTKREIMDLWQMPERFYGFEEGGFHFIVMDCNHILKDGRQVPYAFGNFYIDPLHRDLVDPEQIEWLKAEIDRARKPCVIISHQSFDEVWTGKTVPNRAAVREVIDAANEKGGGGKVVACICGHHHLDHHMVIRDVHYIHINSASYYYVGDGFGMDRGMATYEEPLYCFITFDPRGRISVSGREGRFRSPSPLEKSFPDAARISASISDRKLVLHG